MLVVRMKQKVVLVVVPTCIVENGNLSLGNSPNAAAAVKPSTAVKPANPRLGLMVIVGGALNDMVPCLLPRLLFKAQQQRQ
jgi:hypothetical protein